MSPEICKLPRITKVDGKEMEDIDVIGRKIGVEDLMKELRREKIFMDESGGGVTFSGGEPMMQPDFLIEALKACREEGIHTVVDTSGYASPDKLIQVATLTDLFLFDIKMMDEAQHLHYTGVSNKLILGNLKLLLESGSKVRIRIPVIPEITSKENQIEQIVNFLKQLRYPVEGVELLPFHRTAAQKYKRLGMKNEFEDTPSMLKKELLPFRNQFQQAGIQIYSE
jgi:pyruvate formate lyase activating enzyme